MQSMSASNAESKKPDSVKHHLFIKRWCKFIVLRYEDIALEETVKFQRTGIISEGFGVFLNMAFSYPIKKILKKLNLPEEIWEDIYHDLICVLPPVFYSFRLVDNRPASVHIIMGGYFKLFNLVKQYIDTAGDTLKEDFPDARDEVVWNLEDLLDGIDDYDWAFPPALCKFCAMMILTGQSKSIPPALRRSIYNQDITPVEHVVNHVTVNLRLLLAHSSGLWDMEGALERTIRGFEETENDIHSLRIYDSLRGG